MPAIKIIKKMGEIFLYSTIIVALSDFLEIKNKIFDFDEFGTYSNSTIENSDFDNNSSGDDPNNHYITNFPKNIPLTNNPNDNSTINLKPEIISGFIIPLQIRAPPLVLYVFE